MATATVPTHQPTYNGQAHTDAEALARAQRRIAELERALGAAGAAHNAELAEKDERIARLNRRLAWQADVRRIPSTVLSASAKVTLEALYPQLEHHAQRSADEWYTVFLGTTAKDGQAAAGLAGATGQSRDTVSSNLKAIAACELIEHELVPARTKDGTPYKAVRVRPLAALAEPANVQPPEKPRNHGGKREPTCECGGTLKRKLVCEACNRVYAAPPDDDAPMRQDDALKDEITNEARAEPTMRQDDAWDADDAEAVRRRQFAQLRSWLYELAGGAERVGRVCRMQPTGPDKYKDVKPARFVEPMAGSHLAGEQTYGTTLQRADGRTLALTFDADNRPNVDILLQAMLQLHLAGAYVTLEESPVPDRARLDVFFAEHVNAADARATALRHAPELAGIAEYWPNAASRQATRLPFARYRRGDVDAWCEVAFMDGERLTGLAAAQRVFSDEKTPAAWVTETAEPETPPASSPKREPHAPRSLVITSERLPPNTPRRKPAALTDATWLAKYGANAGTLWFAFTDEYNAEHFNARHDVVDMVDVNAHGYFKATWRNERTASVKLTETNGFIDYGAGATVPAGDALELYCLAHGVSRDVVLADNAHAMRTEATAILEAAAKTGAGLPAWVHAITTPAGWQHYDAIRKDSAPQTRYAAKWRARQAQNSRK